jgi:hypothetical protein
VDPEFTRIVLRVIAIGLVLGGVGTAALFVAFRAFGSDNPRDFRGSLWIAAVLMFIVVGCIILLRLSFVKQ